MESLCIRNQYKSSGWRTIVNILTALSCSTPFPQRVYHKCVCVRVCLLPDLRTKPLQVPAVQIQAF